MPVLTAPATVHRLASDQRRAGGLSGLELSPDGTSLMAVSDRGWAFRIDKQPPHAYRQIIRLGGLHGRSHLADAEALRRLPNGNWLVAFERLHRIMVYRPGQRGLGQLPIGQFAGPHRMALRNNRGLEALAVLPDGHSVAIAEVSGGAPILMLSPRGTSTIVGRYHSDFSPVDAVALANGGLLVLTRSVLWPLPPLFATRLEYVAPGWQGTQSVSGRTLFRLDRYLPAENYEGMAVEALDEDTLRLWLVSDDNMLALQETLLARIDLPTACLNAARTCRLAVTPAPPPPAPVPRPDPRHEP